jgi:histone H3/H4
MEQLIVISKVKKFIKDQAGMNTSANFFEPLNADIVQSLHQAIAHVAKSQRKTVMGKDFNLYIDSPKINEILVVASKIKKFVKDNGGYSTSSQCMEQLTVRVENICKKAIENAQKDKRKTVMDRDFVQPTTLND